MQLQLLHTAAMLELCYVLLTFLLTLLALQHCLLRALSDKGGQGALHTCS